MVSAPYDAGSEGDSAIAEGARNLLIGCAGVRPGEGLLIVAEPAGTGHYEDRVVHAVAAEGRRIGASVTLIEEEVPVGPEALPIALAEAIGAADHTVFLSRIGDQHRFGGLPGSGTKSISYALDGDALGASFGRTPYALFQEVHDLVTQRFLDGRRYTIRCPLGTDAGADLPDAGKDARASRVADFDVRNFPVMIVPAISAKGLSGKLAFSHAFTATAIHIYDDPVVPLASTITATVDNGRIAGFAGDDGLVERVDAHFRRVGGLFDADPYSVDSWHTGINATTYFPAPALPNIHRWGSVSFGSPRYTHFHLCGASPGDISGQIFDATILIDGEPIWSEGRLVLLDERERERLTRKYGVSRDVLDSRLDIGVPATIAA